MNKNVQSKSDQSPLVCAKEDREVKKETISFRKTNLEQTVEWECFSSFSLHIDSKRFFTSFYLE